MELQLIKQEIQSPAFQKKWITDSGLTQEKFNKEASFALQHLDKNPYLLKCTKSSILKSVMNIAHTTLTLNPVLKHAYLVPRKVHGTLECVLDPSYMGLIHLVISSGGVNSISAQIVYEGDEIEIDLSSDKKLIKHIPYMFRGKEKGNIVAVYSLATLHDGSFHYEIMSSADVLEIRERSEAYKAYKAKKVFSCPWVSDEGEMYRKTVVKRQFKYLPKSSGDSVQKAIELDNYANGYDEPIGMNLIGLIESLMQSSALTPEKLNEIDEQLPTLELRSQGLKIIDYLSKNQLDPIRDMANVTSQKQIVKSTEKSESIDNKEQ